jgi:hypothetical protein
MKKCYKCKETKDLDQFYKDVRQKDGKQKACKDCQGKRNKEYTQENIQYFRDKSKQRYKKSENSARYQKYKESNLARRAQYSASVDGRIYSLWYAAKTRAVKKGLEFTITREEILERFFSQDGCCILSGVKFDLSHHGGFSPYTMSIDRIDSTKGYTQENIRLICTALNLAFNSFGEQILVDLFAKITNQAALSKRIKA